MDLTQWIDPSVELAEEAGRAILEVYGTDFEVEEKDDQSPLTKADLAANDLIVAGLSRSLANSDLELECARH